MIIDEEITETVVPGYNFSCHPCPKTIGPALTRKRIIGLIEQHFQMKHEDVNCIIADDEDE